MDYDIGEYYSFRLNGSVYFMSLPSCSIWRGDDLTLNAIEELRGRQRITELELHETLRKYLSPESVLETIKGLQVSQIIKPSGIGAGDEGYRQIPVEPGSITHLVCHVAHSCNLTCTYCYAESGLYGGGKGFTSEETARKYVDFLMKHSGKAPKVSMTFFGGEPLLNFPVVVSTVRYGREQAQARGKTISFDLTTNATLLDQKKIEFLNENRILVTVSIDGPREIHDRVRTRPDGSGTYDTIIRNLTPFLRSRPVPARVTLTRYDLRIREIIDHLLGLGFYQVGISPVDATEEAEFGLGEEEMAVMSEEFDKAADIFLERALEGKYYGFSNITKLLKHFHEGVSKAFPCGAGMQLYAGDPDGRLYMCHRLVGRDAYCVGSLQDGIDTEKQAEFLDSVSVFNKTPCDECWIRYICSGGCYYQSVLHYGDHTKPYTPKCDWLRRWFHKGLEIYITLLERNPAFLEKQTGDALLC